MDDTPMIRTQGLRKSFGATRVLTAVDLTVPRGQVLGLLGPNGAGKTTTVEILSTLLRPDGGTAAVAGHDVVAEPGRVRETISLTGQYAAVDELLTGRENLRLMARLAHLPRAAGRLRGDELLELFDLAGAADRLVRTYSGGMRRRLDLAVSLLTRPLVIFLDEPTTGLDPRSRADLWSVVRDVVAGGATVLLTTQYLDEADALADRIAVLDSGRVIADGTAQELKRQVGAAHVELQLAGGRTERITTDASVPDVRRILADVERRVLPVESWRVAVPTLDDVFLTLTGHRADREASAGSSGAQAPLAREAS
jgi:daunorubicin resistance ABC transporter ATP-binding subunit